MGASWVYSRLTLITFAADNGEDDDEEDIFGGKRDELRSYASF